MQATNIATKKTETVAIDTSRPVADWIDNGFTHVSFFANALGNGFVAKVRDKKGNTYLSAKKLSDLEKYAYAVYA